MVAWRPLPISGRELIVFKTLRPRFCPRVPVDFLRERGGESFKQAVQRAHERLYFERQTLIGQGIERFGVTRVERAGHAPQRPQPAPDDHPHRQAQ